MALLPAAGPLISFALGEFAVHGCSIAILVVVVMVVVVCVCLRIVLFCLSGTQYVRPVTAKYGLPSAVAFGVLLVGR